MKFCYPLRTACLLSLLFLGGCALGGTQKNLAQPIAKQDTYTLAENSGVSTSGCRFDFRQYIPQRPSTATTIILGHGFLRDQNNLIHISRALANEGIPVATLNFCNMRLWNGHHRRNAQDMRSLATSLGVQDNVIFGGFSAGALAALLAADEKTRAILTLDLVDQAGLGLAAAEHLTVPLIGFHGPPHRCNANNNGLIVFAASRAPTGEARPTSQPISNASHCEFESPSNWLCERACGDSASAEDNEETRQTVISLAVERVRPYLTPPL